MTTLSLHHVVRPASGVDPPVLFLLHGIGANERQMALLATFLDPRLLVVSVRSPLIVGPDAFAWFHVRFTAQGPVIDPEEALGGLATLTTFVREAVQEYGGDPDRVYVAGFSQGGIMALVSLLTRPEIYAGAICMSGRLIPEVLPLVAPAPRLQGKPVLVVHGVGDQTLGIQYARWARDQLQRLPLALTYREFPMGHEVTKDSLLFASAWLAQRLDEQARQ